VAPAYASANASGRSPLSDRWQAKQSVGVSMFLIGRLRCAQSTSSAEWRCAILLTSWSRDCCESGASRIGFVSHSPAATRHRRESPWISGAGAPHTRKVNLQNEANSGPLCETKPKLLVQVPPAPPKPIEDPTWNCCVWPKVRRLGGICSANYTENVIAFAATGPIISA